MKNPMTLLVSSLALVACLWLSLDLLAQDDPQPDAGSKWQHLALSHDAEKAWNDKELAKQINKLGREGWELVSVLNFHEEGTTNSTIYYFKKPL